MMPVLQVPTGGDRNFGYLVVREGEALVFDPGHDSGGLERALAASGARLRWLAGSHGHEDHIATLDAWHRAAGAPRVLSRHAGRPAEVVVGDEEMVLPLGAGGLVLRPTPGHTPCSLCLWAPGGGGEAPALLTGDTLFVGKIGGTPDEAAARRQHASLHGLLRRFPAETVVWPGHDVGRRPSSTLGDESRDNPFLSRDLAGFLWLKANWAAYKREHGIP